MESCRGGAAAPARATVRRRATIELFAFVVAIVLPVAAPSPARAQADPFPGVAAAYELRVDGRTLWSHAAERALPPASLTKLMTALLVVEAQRPDALVTATRRAAAATGSRLGLRAGDRFTVASLLTAALVASANDACLALAEWRDGTEARFVERMNRRAAALGLHATRFVNACGHDAPGHVASAADLAVLAQAAMAEASIAERVRLVEARVTDATGARAFRFANRNALIGRYDGAVGVKSGFTARAGKCVIALAERGGVRVLLVLLNGRDRWWDAHALLDRAFAQHGSVVAR